MSYTSLVADAHHAQARGEHFFDQVIFFVVERGAAQMRDGFVLHQALAVLLFDETLVPAFPEAVRNHIHRGFKLDFLPMDGSRLPVFHFDEALGVGGQFETVRTLGAQPAAGERRSGIAFDRDQFIAAMEDELAAADRAIGTNGVSDFGAVVFRAQVERVLGHRFHTGAVSAIQDLFYDGPAGDEFLEHASLREGQHNSLTDSGPDNPQKPVEKRERAALGWQIYPVAGDRLALAIQFGTAWNNFTAFSSV